MTDMSIYKDISTRTNGDIYIGVVGPVRTGKSTFIKRFMDLLVVPNVENTYAKTRITDQLPQSGDGKTITTTEPKFVPDEAVKIKTGNNETMSIRLVDCVGYLIPGVLGHSENGKSRMVKTPWDDEEMPFEVAAEKGTEKVITDHSTVGVMVTCDGSFGELPRENYVVAEKKTINQLKELNKPFIVIMNSANPQNLKTIELAQSLKETYGMPVIPVNAMRMNLETLNGVFQELLGQFPAVEIDFELPGYLDALPKEHWIKADLISRIMDWMPTFEKIGDIKESIELLKESNLVDDIVITNYDMATGKITVEVKLQGNLYYKVIEELMNHPVSSDSQLFMLLKEYSVAKEAYDNLKTALNQVNDNGYGIVHPKLSEMNLGEPEVFKQGNKHGVRLTATAPCLHIIRTDITTEVSPVVGTESQSEDLAKHLMEQFEEDHTKIWETNLFGKSLQDMVTEQMENKLTNVPENLQGKVQKSLQRITDEGKDYFICIIL
ncbi:MAG: stage IV sporulation protein A [Anaerovoracaceae bacterium]